LKRKKIDLEKNKVVSGLTQLMSSDGWRSQAEMLKLITSHVNRYPLMQIQDIYKLLFQGTMGVDHYLPNSQTFEEKLAAEMDHILADSSLPLWEAIRPDGKIVRLNLAACKSRTCEISYIASLCYWTANLFQGDLGDLKNAWNTFQRLCHSHRIQKFPLDLVDQFSHQIEKNRFLPMHHSKIYQQAYKPAYRLVVREFLGVIPELDRNDAPKTNSQKVSKSG